MKHFHDLMKKSNSTKVCSWKTNTSTSYKWPDFGPNRKRNVIGGHSLVDKRV